MKKIIPFMVWGLSLVSLSLHAESAFQLKSPVLPRLADEAAWWTANAALPSFSAVGPCEETPISSVMTGARQYTMPAFEAGFPFERAVPQYWLGDRMEAPDQVDWPETYRVFQTDPAEDTENYLFDPSSESVYLLAGGTRRFKWVIRQGNTLQTNEAVYVVSSVAANRPYRIFWTDKGAPSVMLGNKNVKLFGPPDLLDVRFGMTTNMTAGYRQVVSNVVRGVYVDQSSGALYAVGGVLGQFVLAYYETANLDRVQYVEVVEVARPEVVNLTAHIGEAVRPYGSGYAPDGLVAYPTSDVGEEDPFGPYYYQHFGSESYSPKHREVYPLRPTMDCPWRIEVWWKESDPIGTLWPFEQCHYAADWPERMQVFVRGTDPSDPGLPIRWSTDYTVTLQDYQDPAAHARAPEEGQRSFSTSCEGRALLRFNTKDNVWFLPIQSVFNTNTNYFTREEESWLVGDEIVMRGGALAGTAAGYVPTADSSIPGYIYRPGSGSNYDAESYRPADAKDEEEGTSPPSAIFPVATSERPLEVWWSSSFDKEGMPTPIQIPSLVQCYRARWPEVHEAPQIVLASGLGSDNPSTYCQDIALQFSSETAYANLPNRTYFSSHGGAITFWTKFTEAEPAEARDLVSLGFEPRSTTGLMPRVRITSVSGDTYRVTLGWSEAAASGEVADFTGRDSAARRGEWTPLALVFTPTNAALWAEETCLGTAGFALDTRFVTALGALAMGNTLGASSQEAARRAAVGRAIDSLAFFNEPLDAAARAALVRGEVSPDERALTAFVPFDVGLDLNPVSGSDYRQATERLTGRRLTCYQTVACQPGAPKTTRPIIVSETPPVVYVQNDPSGLGYNPNNEHAFVRAGETGWTLWALRDDLEVENQRPAVLVRYRQEGAWKMRYYAVVATNADFPVLAGTCEAGAILPGPSPFNLFDEPFLLEDYWDETAETSPAWRDRKNQIWARAAGTLNLHKYYPMQAGFWFPASETTPEIGTPIPWLTRHVDRNASVFGPPVAWTWSVHWPKQVAEMRIGQTLTRATGSLPDVWGMKSCAIVWPNQTSVTNASAREDVTLIDPTAVRRTGLTGFTNVAAMMTALGFEVKSGGACQARRGLYYFRELPPTLANRFYLDPTADPTECVALKGELDEPAAGAAILKLNVLSAAERTALKHLVDEKNPYATAWSKMLDAFAGEPIAACHYYRIPSNERYTTKNETRVEYLPVDRYALTAMGGTNYVTLIENDNPDTTIVDSGDSVSMYVLKVVPAYYTGRVVSREDEQNLLSQKLDILYTESLGGYPDDFEFEWYVREPRFADWTKMGEAAAGRVRFTLGEAGDTLDNLVNKYYTCRYRGRVGTRAWAIMGEAWSELALEGLAEGWVQRVLNNMTPFTQRVTDFYENASETAVSMLRQAGRPWEGDVALNSDNISEVGLIQLYQTLLDKAESLSIRQGASSASANQQLLLATERLADLYQILGDEAYTDALNPTIGFGREFTLKDTSLGVDYGARSTGLFCFDNQVSTLLDEELALLRGRDTRAPSPVWNRLVWNFTRGLNAGEVAYAENYNISGSNGKIDANEAAVLYPQGHGDAWGHYLSALMPYYRLLRNPHFNWGEPQAGEMNVGDFATSVDYKDEQRFTQIACAAARTAEAIVSRTACQMWQASGELSGAGYHDAASATSGRNFGYGDWATRGGIGALANWAIANSLLPEESQAKYYHQLGFTDEIKDDYPDEGEGFRPFHLSTYLVGTYPDTVSLADSAASWTWECQIEPEKTQLDPFGGWFFGWEGPQGASMKLGYAGAGDLSILFSTNAPSAVRSEDEIKVDVATWTLGSVRPGERTVLALSHEANASTIEFRAIDANGVVTRRTLPLAAWPLAGGTATFGMNFRGTVHEVRFWNKVRSDTELFERRFGTTASDRGLVFQLRTFARESDATQLVEDVTGQTWDISNGSWTPIERTGMRVDFDDEGLGRITRAKVPELSELAREIESLQKTVERLDAGMNPLGLSSDAVPFDITPLGVEEGTATHFEQVLSRAETALANAAKVLDRAQSASARLRQIEEAADSADYENSSTEFVYETKLIELFGYPYAGDVGPGKTYPEGYSGPDYYHYMWMDLSPYGLEKLPDEAGSTVVRYKPNTSTNQAIAGATHEIQYHIAANGLIVKPSDIKGARRAIGKLQQAYADFVTDYVDFLAAQEKYTMKVNKVSYLNDKIRELTDSRLGRYWLEDAHIAAATVKTINTAVLKASKKKTEMQFELVKAESDSSKDLASQVSGAGTTLVTDAMRIPVALSANLRTIASLLVDQINAGVTSGLTIGLETADATTALAVEAANNRLSRLEAKYAELDTVREIVYDVWQAATELEARYARLQAKAENFTALVEEGTRLQEEREAYRRRMASTVTRLRYDDQFFRQTRNRALARYESAFELARRYAFLAAAVYDYETVQLPKEDARAEALRAAIVSARSVGALTESGEPLLGDGTGDPGLSDILARLKANWLVLKPRLGLNNPQRDTTWFSLRRECFRIADDAAHASDWQRALRQCWCEDLRTSPEFRRFCQMFRTSAGSSLAEPGLIIPFSTTIDFAKNFFGHDLAGGDAAFDSTYFATKIAAAGVWFKGYNARRTGYTGAPALSATPSVYLVPVGYDCLREPGSDEGTYRMWNVVDQVVPLPFTLSASDLDETDWQPFYDGYTGEADLAARIRRYPSFRALTTNPGEPATEFNSTRLIGRSVWNTRWLLIIPAGTLSGGDRVKALETFVFGRDLTGDGVCDLEGVEDIQIGLKTYSVSGQ